MLGTLQKSPARRSGRGFGEGQISRRPADDSYRDACLTKRSECEAQGTTFADDNCLLSSLMEEAVLAQANQCLAKSCAEIPSCLRPIFQ